MKIIIKSWSRTSCQQVLWSFGTITSHPQGASYSDLRRGPMAFFGLVSFGRDDDDDDDDRKPDPERCSSSSDGDDSESDDVADAGVPGAGPSTGGGVPPTTAPLVLPSPDDAFGQVNGPPTFLVPEATRPIARNASHAPPPTTRRRDVSDVDQPEVSNPRQALVRKHSHVHQ